MLRAWRRHCSFFLRLATFTTAILLKNSLPHMHTVCGQYSSSYALTILSDAGLVRSALDASLSFGRAAAGVRGPLKAWRRKALQSIFEAGNSLRLQFPLEDLGFCYTAHGSAICLPGHAASDRAPPALHAASDSAQQNVRAQQDRGLAYVQNTQPGSRLPHCELKILASEQRSSGHVTHPTQTESSQVEQQGSHADGSMEAATVRRGAAERSIDQDGRSLSTHDLLNAGSTSLLMLLGPGRAAAVWAAAARRLDAELQTFNIVQIHNDPKSADNLHAETAPPEASHEIAQDVIGRWKKLRQVRSQKRMFAALHCSVHIPMSTVHVWHHSEYSAHKCKVAIYGCVDGSIEGCR